jgi:hypothetical protein
MQMTIDRDEINRFVRSFFYRLIPSNISVARRDRELLVTPAREGGPTPTAPNSTMTRPLIHKRH